jgi:hypothetical protein
LAWRWITPPAARRPTSACRSPARPPPASDAAGCCHGQASVLKFADLPSPVSRLSLTCWVHVTCPTGCRHALNPASAGHGIVE